jgi:hypothetical protein
MCARGLPPRVTRQQVLAILFTVFMVVSSFAYAVAVF